MGCLMNILWLVFGGIFTAIEYVMSSLLMMITNIENGRTCFMAFWKRGT